MTKAGGKAVIRAKITGDFPGSPAALTFTFGQQDGRIAELEIG